MIGSEQHAISTALRAFLRRQWPLLLVLLMVVAAMLLITTQHWRRGSATLGAALVAAAGLRAVLREQQAGLLSIRGRRFDVGAYTAFGAALGLVAASIGEGSLG